MQFIDKYQQILVDAVQKFSFKDQPSELYEPMNYIISHGGKRLRPVLVLMATDLFGGDTSKALKPALAIEFFHNFTLIHDDIMDEAPLRRNVSTVHTIYGINSGILSGDGLLLKSYQFFEDLEPNLYKNCLKIFTNTGVLLCEGQQLDVNFETQENVTYDNYITMISCKTAVLVAASLEIGALIGGAKPQDAEAIYNFGKHIGIAFQIMDDYLDVFGKQESFGKKHAGDIYENKKTVLYLLAKENATQEDRKELDFWYSQKTENPEKVEKVVEVFKNSKADEKALELVKKHNEIAEGFLQKIDMPSERKQPLVELANYLLGRES